MYQYLYMCVYQQLVFFASSINSSLTSSINLCCFWFVFSFISRAKPPSASDAASTSRPPANRAPPPGPPQRPTQGPKIPANKGPPQTGSAVGGGRPVTHTSHQPYQPRTTQPARTTGVKRAASFSPSDIGALRLEFTTNTRIEEMHEIPAQCRSPTLEQARRHSANRPVSYPSSSQPEGHYEIENERSDDVTATASGGGVGVTFRGVPAATASTRQPTRKAPAVPSVGYKPSSSAQQAQLLAGARTGAHAPPAPPHSRGVDAHGTGGGSRAVIGQAHAAGKYKPDRPALPPIKAAGGAAVAAAPPTAAGAYSYTYCDADQRETVPNYSSRPSGNATPNAGLGSGVGGRNVPNNHYQNVPNSSYANLVGSRGQAPADDHHVTTSPQPYMDMSRDSHNSQPNSVSKRINMFEQTGGSSVLATDIEAKLSTPSLDTLGSTDNKRPVPRPRSMAQTSCPPTTSSHEPSKPGLPPKPAVATKPSQLVTSKPAVTEKPPPSYLQVVGKS